jgi:hypothetical protein
MTVKFTKGAPKEPGKYLRKTFMGIELVTVFWYTSTFLRRWDSDEYDRWLAVAEYGGKSVNRYDDGWFSDKIEEEELTKFPEDAIIKTYESSRTNPS